jgi:hypothetical protein
MKNLILHIEQIKDKIFHQDFEENADAFPILADMLQNHECEFLEPLKIRIKAFSVRDLFEVQGALQTRVRLTCSRCLKDFDTSFKSEFELTYTKELASITETSAEESGFYISGVKKLTFGMGSRSRWCWHFRSDLFALKPARACARIAARISTRAIVGVRLRPLPINLQHKFAALKDLKLDN